MKPKQKYECVVCGLVSEHLALRRNRTICVKCGKKTKHVLMSSGGKIAVPPVAQVAQKVSEKPTVAVEHVPLMIEPEPTTTAKPQAPGAAEEWPEEGAGEGGVILDSGAWADLYGFPAQTVSLALQAPQLKLSDETCKLQGQRISRFCIRHNIKLPPYLDAVPILGHAVGDYSKLFLGASMKMKEKRQQEKTKTPSEIPGETSLSESPVEHRAAESIPDLDAKLERAITQRR